ncbi:phosphopentomutase-like isoform X2 [Lineus longissimus]
MTAVIFLNAEIPVYLYSEICPTPFVPYGVLHYGCDVGVMITASHNPKEDNGYKVYWSNGAQIIPPHDSGIAECILQNLAPWPNSWNISAVESHPLRSDPYKETMNCYFEDIGKQLCKHRDANAESPLKFTYTAMHGVGHRFAQESFRTFGFKPFIPVKEQVEPDPEFPTVKFPNPEEGKSALNLSIKTANEHGSSIILANDPDADRLAVAEKQPSGDWKVFTGNETGALFGWWLLTCHRNSGKEAAADVYMLSSTVSSKILKTLAEKEGFSFEETLTGFKWMGNRAHELLKEGKEVLFAFEEAIGFMCGTVVLDKDGVSAMSCMAECATYLHARGLTLTQQLNLLYNKYGIHKTSNSYFLCYHQPVIERIFERIRNLEGPGKYPSRCGRFEIKYVRDLMTGYDSSENDLKACLPVSSSSQMLTFTFANGCVATIRTSGTEPKVKYYTEYLAPPSLDEASVEKELKEMVENIVDVFLEPVKNELVPRSE